MAHSDDTEMLCQLYGYASGGAIQETTWFVSEPPGPHYAEVNEDWIEEVMPRRRRGDRGGEGLTIQINAPIFGVDHLHAEMDRAYDRNERRKSHERTVRTR